MKIAIACADIQPSSGEGGIAVYTRHLATGLAARGHQVTILGRTEGKSVERAERGVRIVFLPDTRYLHLHPKARRHTNRIARAKTLAKHLANHGDFDVVEFPVWDAEGLYAARLKNFKSVVRGHTPHSVVNELAVKAGQGVAKLDRVAEILERSAARRADLYLANSSSSARIAIDRFRIPSSRVAICLHGIPLQSRANDVHSENIRVLFVGRLEVRKGVLELFKAIPRIIASCPNVQFEIIGSDSDYESGTTFQKFFERSAHSSVLERVTFHGRLPSEEIELIQRQCQIAVLPSKYESFGLVHAEALSFGIPVVAFDISATREVIDHDVNGLLVPEGDSDALADACISLIRDQELRVKMGVSAFESALSRFSVEAMSACVETAYLRVIQGSS